MKRWLAFLVLVAVIAVAVIGMHTMREKRAQQQRDVAYQSVLRRYSEVLKPGMTRKEVEDYLVTRNVSFRQMCCVNWKEPKRAYDDLAKIAQEDPPWVCNEKNIYIAFQFAGNERQRLGGAPTAEPSDRLTIVSLYRALEVCP